MTDRPIIFSAPMIRALLDGRKTMTRRVLKPQPELLANGRYHIRNAHGGAFGVEEQDVGSVAVDYVPYCEGDRLWVREGFAVHKNADPRIYPKGEGHPWGSPIYKATFGGGLAPICEGFSPWKPSVDMPRWASRLTLIVESVKVERLQDISETDAIAEGIETTEYWREDHPPSICFSVLWDSINGHDAWNANPWVCAIIFRVVKANIDALCEEATP